MSHNCVEDDIAEIKDKLYALEEYLGISYDYGEREYRKEKKMTHDEIMNQLDHDASGHLRESDAILREEIMNHKIDYLIALIGALAQLTSESHGGSLYKAINNYNERADKARVEAKALTDESLKQYLERR